MSSSNSMSKESGPALKRAFRLASGFTLKLSDAHASGYTLIELLVSLAVIGIIVLFSIGGVSKLKDSLDYWNTVNQVMFDVKLTQQLAETSHASCDIQFKSGGSEYKILQNGSVARTLSIDKQFTFSGKDRFSFAPSGDTNIGGSGTLCINGRPNVKKLIVSSEGRVRIE